LNKEDLIMSIETARVGVVGKTIYYSGLDLSNANAGFHNSIYRGKFLGTSYTAE
jgi:hypothetical protein